MKLKSEKQSKKIVKQIFYYSLLTIEDKEYKKKLDSIWRDIELRYSQKKFNGFINVAYILDMCNNYSTEFNLAAIFYNIINEVVSNENTYNSATYAKLVLTRLGLEEDFITSVCNLILHESFIENYNETKEMTLPELEFGECIVFGDIIKSILAIDYKYYKKYTKYIKKEYSIFGEKMQSIGRLDYLMNIINNETIFNSDEFINSYEDIARENINKEILQIKRKQDASKNSRTAVY